MAASSSDRLAFLLDHLGIISIAASAVLAPAHRFGGVMNFLSQRRAWECS